MDKNLSKNISKNVGDKYCQKLLDHGKQPATKNYLKNSNSNNNRSN